MVQKYRPLGLIFYIHTKVASMSLKMKFQGNPAENVQENRQKPIYWPIVALFGTKNFLGKGPKTSKISIFKLFFVIKDPLKSRRKNHNSTPKTVWEILLCTFISNIEMIGWKGSLFDFKNVVQTNGRTTHSSASDKLRWLCRQRS